MKCKICGDTALVGDLSPLSHFASKHMDIVLNLRAGDSLNNFLKEKFMEDNLYSIS